MVGARKTVSVLADISSRTVRRFLYILQLYDKIDQTVR